MRLVADPDAGEFGAAVGELLSRSAGSAELRAAWDSPDGRVPGVWAALAEMGALGLTAGEEHGGAGLDITAAVPLLTAAGRACLPEPLGEAVVAAALLSAAGGPVAAEWLPRLVAGKAVVGVGVGPGALVTGGGWADLLLLPVGSQVHAVPRSQLQLTPVVSVDAGSRPALAAWEPAEQTLLPGVDVDLARNLAAVAAAAQLVGLAGAMLDMAVAYAKTREQFGRVIGSFQAVKHQLADRYVGNAFAVPVVARGAWSVAHRVPGASRDASHAQLAASTAAAAAARTALQVHAGIGYTFEHDLHMWMKRSWSLRSLHGDDSWHRARLAASVLADDPPPRLP